MYVIKSLLAILNQLVKTNNDFKLKYLTSKKIIDN